MDIFAFLPDSPLSFCGQETQTVCWNLAACNENCKFILSHNRRESWEGLRFVSTEITAQPAVLGPACAGGSVFCARWHGSVSLSRDSNEQKEINCTGWHLSANCFGQAVLSLPVWPCSFYPIKSLLLQRRLDPIALINSSCLLQLALPSEGVTGAQGMQQLSVCADNEHNATKQTS